MNKNLLVVDWDFFFPDLDGSGKPGSQFYDWGHKETEFFIHNVWGLRAATFLSNDMPLPQVNDEWKTFWDRFTFSPGAELFFAESNCYAVQTRVTPDVGRVYLFDAHHDSGYNDSRTPKQIAEQFLYGCEDWMIHYWATEASLQVIYPRWKTWAFEAEPRAKIYVPRMFDDPNTLRHFAPFDKVFVCRSGAWVPSWCDPQFEEFIDMAPLPIDSKIALDEGGFLPRRDFDLESVEEMAASMEMMRKGSLAEYIRLATEESK